MLPSQNHWDESENSLRGATQIQGLAGPPLASWYGEGAVGVSAPAPPLSFIQAEQGAFSGAPLSGDRFLNYCCGIFTVESEQIVCFFSRNVKRWDGWRD